MSILLNEHMVKVDWRVRRYSNAGEYMVKVGDPIMV